MISIITAEFSPLPPPSPPLTDFQILSHHLPFAPAPPLPPASSINCLWGGMGSRTRMPVLCPPKATARRRLPQVLPPARTLLECPRRRHVLFRQTRALLHFHQHIHKSINRPHQRQLLEKKN